MGELFDEWSDEGRIVRTSHALVAGGRVWVIDPVDVAGLDERVRGLGEPAAVLQLLDRHNRDCAAVASRLGVEHLRGWEAADLPFAVLPVRRNRFWREVALWEPETRTLVSPEMLGTVPQFRAPGERLGWHPLARPFPPRKPFEGLDPERILVGHGPALVEDAGEALRDLLANGRRRLFAALRALRTSA
jgi:hypothetical protein